MKFSTIVAVALSFLTSVLALPQVEQEKRYGAEALTCYNAGTSTSVDILNSVIDDFCKINIDNGTSVSNGEVVQRNYDYGDVTIYLSATALNGCSWKFDDNCGRLLRRPISECNEGQDSGKQGGYVTDLCAQWRTDPGSNGNML
ncbi:putative LysM domain-containing protein [Mycena kentingensis (nom. inval.)]|nr:putative LysM domain-containing protein [Mycena kentingensis (nom. inval.)]